MLLLWKPTFENVSVSISICYCNQCPTTMSSIFPFKIATNCLCVAADLVRESDCKQVDYNGLWGLWNFKSNYIVLDPSLYLHIWYLVPPPPPPPPSVKCGKLVSRNFYHPNNGSTLAEYCFRFQRFISQRNASHYSYPCLWIITLIWIAKIRSVVV